MPEGKKDSRKLEGVMYKDCRTERSAQRQRQFAHEMMEMLYHQPYEDITISMLCERVNMPRKAFYRYFESKRDILFLIADEFLHHYENENNLHLSKQQDTLQEEMKHIFVAARQSKSLFRVLERDSLRDTYFGYIIEQCFSNADITRRLVLQNTQTQLWMSYLFVTSGLLILIVDWLSRGCLESEQEMAETAASLFTQPLITMD